MLHKIVFLVLAILLVTAMALPIAAPQNHSNAQQSDEGVTTISGMQDLATFDPTCPPGQPGTCG